MTAPNESIPQSCHSGDLPVKPWMTSLAPPASTSNRSIQAHAGAEAAVELDDDGAAYGFLGGGVEFVEVGELGEGPDGREVSAGDEAEIAGTPAAYVFEKGARDERRGAVGIEAGADGDEGKHFQSAVTGE